MSAFLCVLQPDPVRPPAGAVAEQPGAGPHAGFAPLEQSLLWLGPNAAADRATGSSEETLFVLEGDGALCAGGRDHPIETESGASLAPGQEYELAAGAQGLRVVAVRIPDPVSPADATENTAPVVRRLADQTAQDATTERQFRIVSDPRSGLQSATHFVGYIPPTRAPEHFHTYDEVIYVLEGLGVFHADGAPQPIAAGTCIGLPARKVHCLENTGEDVMRVVAVFRPAGSPAAAYYPDGTPAFPGIAAATQT